ncbi:MAG: DUF2752 domain-containing protein [Chitinophagaceae bacterium]|nr:DUF2752 domain-containing protein [Chitinophagaceae bacterium]
MVCPVKKYLHFDCPGCGLQRSLAALLRGDLALSITLHPVTIPLLLFFLFAVLHLTFKFSRGSKIIVCSYIFVAAIIVTNYIYKIVHQHLT